MKGNNIMYNDMKSRKTLRNPHSIISSAPGCGKRFLLFQEIKKILKEDESDKIYILDVDGNYRYLQDTLEIDETKFQRIQITEKSIPSDVSIDFSNHALTYDYEFISGAHDTIFKEEVSDILLSNELDVNRNARAVVFDLSNLSDKLHPFAAALCLHTINKEVHYNRNTIYSWIYLDAFRYINENSIIGYIVCDMLRRYRTLRGILTTFMDIPEDRVHHQIVQSSGSFYLLRQSYEGASRWVDLLFTDRNKNEIVNRLTQLEIGKGLLFSGGSYTPFQIIICGGK